MLAVCALSSGALVLVIVGFLTIEAWPALRRLGLQSFFADVGWHPSEGAFGSVPMIVASLVVTLGAVMLAAPVGIGTALYLHGGAPRWASFALRQIHGVAAAVPSVVWGLFGITVMVPWLARWHPPGTSALAGMLVLSLMVLPTLTLFADASLAAVPTSWIQSAAALGLDRWATLRSVVIPIARPGLFAAVCLSVARALGETMAVLMVCGNVVDLPTSLFDPVRTLTANIALEMAYATGVHRSSLFVSGLLLLVPVATMGLTAELLRRSRRG